MVSAAPCFAQPDTSSLPRPRFANTPSSTNCREPLGRSCEVSSSHIDDNGLVASKVRYVSSLATATHLRERPESAHPCDPHWQTPGPIKHPRRQFQPALPRSSLPRAAQNRASTFSAAS